MAREMSLLLATTEMMSGELERLLDGGPGSTHKRSYPMTDSRITSSMKAVFSRPEKPIPCRASVRSACVPRRITCVTRASLRRR